MIDAKGQYAEFLDKKIGKIILARKWLDQAQRQVDAAGSRAVEWYFHDASAAAFATALFAKPFGTRLIVHHLPYPGGVPDPNPRVH